MLARHYIARKEREFRAKHPELFQQQDTADREVAIRERELAVQRRELAVWHREQVAKWEERKRQAEADGREFNDPPPEPPPGIGSNGRG